MPYESSYITVCRHILIHRTTSSFRPVPHEGKGVMFSLDSDKNLLTGPKQSTSIIILKRIGRVHQYEELVLAMLWDITQNSSQYVNWIDQLVL